MIVRSDPMADLAGQKGIKIRGKSANPSKAEMKEGQHSQFYA
jgi:hypothetical protein